jgi:hypothetical protein
LMSALSLFVSVLPAFDALSFFDTVVVAAIVISSRIRFSLVAGWTPWSQVALPGSLTVELSAQRPAPSRCADFATIKRRWRASVPQLRCILAKTGSLEPAHCERVDP